SGSKRTKSALSSTSAPRKVRSLGSPQPAPTNDTFPSLTSGILSLFVSIALRSLLWCARRYACADDRQRCRCDLLDGVVGRTPARTPRAAARRMDHVEVAAPESERPSAALIDLVEAPLADDLRGRRVDLTNVRRRAIRPFSVEGVETTVTGTRELTRR